MLPFSTLSQTLPGVSSIVLPCTMGSGSRARETRIIRVHGSASSIFETLRTLHADNADFCRWIKQRDDRGNEWLGMSPTESTREYLATGSLPSAIAAMKKAAGAINTPLARASQTPSFIGSSFNVGRIVQGHPKPCYTRPRAKLPTKNIEFYAGYSAGVDSAALIPTFAKIAKCVNDYTLKGGLINVRLNFLMGFNRANEGHDGFVLSVDIPVGNLSALSAVCSVAFHRALSIPLGKTLSGEYDDSLPRLVIAAGKGHQITGIPATDSETLAALSIE